MRCSNHRGMVLVFSLWVLGVLTVLAVSVAAGVRQKITLVGRLDERSRMSYLLQGAVKKAAAHIHQQMQMSSFEYTVPVKMALSTNASELAGMVLGRDRAAVASIKDEEGKINLNKTDVMTLTHLLMRVLSLKDTEALKLARALLDWRQYGESELTGFFSDEYYSNLDHPYSKKSTPYESMDEILLVKGMTKEMYDKLINFVTIYGDGTVNINTASREVLDVLGLSDTLIDKILIVRRGRDGMDGTADDRVFSRTFEITVDLAAVIRLTPEEARAIDAVNMRGLLGTNSFYFTIEAVGALASRSNPRSVRAVYSSREDKILYWNER